MVAGAPVISTNCQSGPSEILNLGNSFNYANGFKPVKYGVLTEVDNIKGITNSLIYLSVGEAQDFLPLPTAELRSC